MGHHSRHACSAAVTAFLLTLVLAACAATSTGSRAANGPGGSENGPSRATVADFTTRARQVIAQWDRSPLAKTWRSGLVLLDPAEVTSIPGNTGFTSQHQKDALDAGRFVLDGTLPPTRLSGRITWPGGGTTVPVLSAPATFHRLAAYQPCTNGPCGNFTVTGARPSSMVLLTNRGSVTVPAWTFTVRQPRFTVTEAALAPGSYTSLPSFNPLLPPVAPPLTFDEAGLSAISRDGRVLTLAYDPGLCPKASGALVYPAATAVVIGSWNRCGTGKAGGDFTTSKMRLAAPLGTRPVLNAFSGEPEVINS
jgi:hypothetical protein